MASFGDSSANVSAAGEAMRRGDFGRGFKILREGLQAVGDDDPGYPGETSVGDGPYWPYQPPRSEPQLSYPPQNTVAIPPGWYIDPFDGVGHRWWNGQGWTSSTNG